METTTLEALPISLSWGETLQLGRKAMTLTAKYWYLAATNGLRGDQIDRLNAVLMRISDEHGSPTIGGNHVLEALLETTLYQRVWPGHSGPTP